MAEQNPNLQPEEQETSELEKSLEELSLDELLASVKNDLARVDAMMDGADAGGHLTGALCINLDTTKVTEQIAFLQSFLPAAPQSAGKAEEEPASAPAHVSVMIENLMDKILADCDAKNLSREERIRRIRFMDEKGLFLMKGSVERAAEKLGVGKVTIYSYLDEVRGKRG